MSLNIGSANPYNSYSSRSAPENFSAINSVRSEANKIISDGLVGENTTVTTRLDFNSISIDYWSEKAQAQWSAYSALDDSIGKSAAKYHEQFINERQATADDYLKSYLNLARKFSEEYSGSASFSDVFYSFPDASKDSGIQTFIEDHRGAIYEAKRLKDELVDFPKDLLAWGEKKNIEFPQELKSLVKEMEFEWANHPSDPSQSSGFSCTSSTFNMNDNVLMYESTASYNHPSDKFYDIQLHSSQSWAGKGDTTQLEKWLGADGAYSEFKKELYHQYTVLKNSAHNAFESNSLLSGSGFSLEKIINNYINGNDIAELDNGNLHKESDSIHDFWDSNSLLIKQYIYKMDELNSIPKTASDFYQLNSAYVRKYTSDNFDHLMSLREME